MITWLKRIGHGLKRLWRRLVCRDTKRLVEVHDLSGGDCASPQKTSSSTWHVLKVGDLEVVSVRCAEQAIKNCEAASHWLHRVGVWRNAEAIEACEELQWLGNGDLVKGYRELKRKAAAWDEQKEAGDRLLAQTRANLGRRVNRVGNPKNDKRGRNA